MSSTENTLGETSIAQWKAACAFCGYDLSGNSSGVCPECGRPVDRYTARAREVILEANRHALVLLSKGDPLLKPARWWLPQATGSPEIAPSHILLGLLSGPQGVGYHAILSCGADTGRLRDTVVACMPRRARRTIGERARLPLASASQLAVSVAHEEAMQLGHNWVGTEHLLLALCRPSTDSGIRKALKEATVTHDQVRTFIVANMAAVQQMRTS